MFKSVKNIIIILLILILLGAFPLVMILMALDENIQILRDTSIVFNEEGIIKVKEKMTLITNEDKTYDEIAIKRTLFVNSESHVFPKPNNVKVYLNDKLLKETKSLGENVNTMYFVSGEEILLKNINLKKDFVSFVEINYEYNTYNAIQEYKNLDLLKLMTDKKVSSSNIKIQLPRETNRFDLKSNAKIEYLGNNTYNITGKMKIPYTELLIDKGIIKNSKVINQEYEISDIKRTLNIEDIGIKIALVIFSTITLIAVGTIFIVTRRTKMGKIYVRNPEEVINPILAESLIDRKIGAKELIMSCIVELIYRGNLKNIGNESVKLISVDNISEYELKILKLIFKEKNQIVTFEEIKEMFVENNEKTQVFFNKFKEIKEIIEKNLFDYNIYSKTGEMVLKMLKVISMTILLNMVYMLCIVVNPVEKLDLIDLGRFNILAMSISIFASDFYIDITKSKKVISVGLINKNIIHKISFIMLSIITILCLIYQGYKHIGAILVIAIIFILNIIVLRKANTHILTKTGIFEFTRAQGLKDYIVDYSLMKERDIESTIIWDEYLAYAVAFGIPNKITNKFCENLMNTNIILQKIESVLKM